jgi:hypothetical protein
MTANQGKRPQLRKVSQQSPVTINPTTWVNGDKYPHTREVIAEPPASLTRDELRTEAMRFHGDPTEEQAKLLFVKTMMWGSGKSNGRGPRYTNKALESGLVAKGMSDIRKFLGESNVVAAYHVKISGVGEAFHTKLLWVVGSALPGLTPKPLILDSRVRRGINRLPESDKNRLRNVRGAAYRYLEYLAFCREWVGEDGEPEDAEYTLYLPNDK